MDPEQLQRHRRSLETRRGQLREEGDLAVEPVRVDAVTAADLDTQPLAEMSQSIASRRNQTRTGEMADIEHALAKIQAEPSDYGLCEDCEEAIAPRRLQAMPSARLCIRCKGRRESDTPGGRRTHLTDYQ